jgi:CRISPR system Cascade subunit CasD
MTDYLIFQLYGPMAAWGEIAVGEIRPSYSYPSKSAIFGLVAAALGIKRDQEEEHRKLSECYGFAVLVKSPGIPLSDYHTIQVPSSGTGRNRRVFTTRRDEIITLPKEELKTILSRRDYRMDALYAVALWKKFRPPYELKDIAHKLDSPMYALYLGRKSCPLAIPVEPQIVEADTVREAFTKARFTHIDELRLLPLVDKSLLYWEEGAEPGVEPHHIFERRDVNLSRKRWQFDVRREYHATYPEEG